MPGTPLRYAFEHVLANAILVIACLTFFPLDDPLLWLLLFIVLAGSLAVQHFRVKRLRQRQGTV